MGMNVSCMKFTWGGEYQLLLELGPARLAMRHTLPQPDYEARFALDSALSRHGGEPKQA